MNKLFLLLFLIIFSFTAKSDELQVPYSCYPRELQAKFAEYDVKLDLSANDRTKDSWGFLKSKGSKYSIFTYESATEEDFNLIMRIVQGGVWEDG